MAGSRQSRSVWRPARTSGASRPRAAFGALLGLLAVLLALPAAAAATTINVTNANDSGVGSLRAAIKSANHLPGFDRIAIKAMGTIRVHSSLPDLEAHLAIRGPGPNLLAVNGGALVGEPPLSVTSSADVFLRGISITHGHFRDTSIPHGPEGIANDGNLTVSRCRVGKMRYGTVAIRNRGSLTLLHSTLGGNFYLYTGIVNDGKLTVAHSSLAAQSVIILNRGSLTVFDSALYGSVDPEHGGGSTGIDNQGVALVRRSTLEANGDGIQNEGDLTILQSTMSGNEDAIGNSGTASISRSTVGNNFGGGIGNSGSLTVTQSTLAGNGHDEFLGGPAIGTGGPPSSAVVKSTIIAYSGGTFGSEENCSGNVTSKGFNIADDGTCNLGAQGDQPNTDPLLRPLGNYGGPTRTFALPKTSPAIDAGFGGPAQTDQRGLARIVDYPGVPTAAGGDNSDVGAFELQTP
jgi:hypothetical protein